MVCNCGELRSPYVSLPMSRLLPHSISTVHYWPLRSAFTQAIRKLSPQTGNGELERVVWSRRRESHFETIGLHKRFVETSHHIDLVPFGQLLLAPDYWVVEQVVRVRPEGALQPHGVATVDHMELRVRQLCDVIVYRTTSARTMFDCDVIGRVK